MAQYNAYGFSPLPFALFTYKQLIKKKKFKKKLQKNHTYKDLFKKKSISIINMYCITLYVRFYRFYRFCFFALYLWTCKDLDRRMLGFSHLQILTDDL